MSDFVSTKTIEVPIDGNDVFAYMRQCNDPVLKAQLVNLTLRSMTDAEFVRMKSYFAEYTNEHCMAQLEIIKIARDALNRLEEK